MSVISASLTGVRARIHERRLAHPAVLLGVLTVASLLWLLQEGRGDTFQSDEWDWLLNRRGHALGVFLRPHNEHLSALPILAYKIFFSVFGAQSSFPYRLLDAMLACTCSVLLYVLLARRVGSWIALSTAAVFLFLGPAWSDIIWGFQIGYLGSVAAGLGAFLLLERRDRLGDIGASVLLLAGLACSSVAIPILAGTALLLALRWREDRWRRLWVVGVPAAVYLVWYSHYGVSSIQFSYVRFIPMYVFHGLAAVAGALTGLTAPSGGSPYALSLDAGQPLAALLLVALVVQLMRGTPFSRDFWSGAAVAFVFWAAAALSYIPGREANVGRYTYPVAPFVVLAIVGCLATRRVTPRASLVVGIVAIVAIVSNLGFLRQGAHLFDITSRFARTELGALEIARGVVPASFAPETPAASEVIGVHNLTPIVAGRYFSAIDAYGSQADHGQALLRAPDDAREAADFVLLHAEEIRLTPFKAGLRACMRHQPTEGAVYFNSGPGELIIRTGSEPAGDVSLRRFADTFHFASVGAIKPHATVSMALPKDRSLSPWNIRVLTAAAISVCT